MFQRAPARIAWDPRNGCVHAAAGGTAGADRAERLELLVEHVLRPRRLRVAV
jgi:hypothetical protein